jgi:hypothetical protein
MARTGNGATTKRKRATKESLEDAVSAASLLESKSDGAVGAILNEDDALPDIVDEESEGEETFGEAADEAISDDAEDEEEEGDDEDQDTPDEEEDDSDSDLDDEDDFLDGAEDLRPPFPVPKTIVSDITGRPKRVYPEIEPDYDSDSSTEEVRALSTL